ncbi:MAG: hypothetical protein ACUVTG_00345 [Candidatus Oleimicrobiaceae bacterium]
MNPSPQDEKQASAQEKRLRRVVLLLLVVATLIHILAYFNRFAVPNSDFFAFRRDALAYLRLELPENFKRGPTYPLLMGLSSLAMPGEEPELLAGEIVNVVLSLVLVYLSYRIGTQLLGAAGLAVAFAVAISPVLMPSATQPLAEAALAVGIALTAYLAMRGSALAYAAAAAASMTRYEAALLLPLLVVKDLWEHKRLMPTLLRGAVASGPIALWCGLSILKKGVINPYLGEMVKLPPAGLGNLVSCIAVSFKFLLPFSRRAVAAFGAGVPGTVAVGGALVALGLALFGLLRLGKQGTPIGWLLELFLVGYLLIHTFFWWAIEERYTYVVLWIVFLGIASAVLALPWRQRPVLSGHAWVAVAVGFLLVGVAGAVLVGLRFGRVIALVYLLFAGAGLIAVLWPPGKPLKVDALVLGILVVASTLGGVVVTANDMAGLRHYRAPYRVAGEWLRAHAAQGARIVSLLPLTVAYYAHIPEHQVRGYFSFPMADCANFVARLQAGQVDYVIWDSQAAVERRTYGNVLHRVDLMRCLFSEDGEAKVPQLSLVVAISVDHKRLRIFRVEREAETNNRGMWEPMP